MLDKIRTLSNQENESDAGNWALLKTRLEQTDNADRMARQYRELKNAYAQALSGKPIDFQMMLSD